MSLLGSAVLSLSPEDMLLVLCAHGATGCWARLLLVCDVAQLISAQPDMDWTRVLEQASRTGSLRRLLLGLLLARDLLGAAIPCEALSPMALDTQLPRLAAQIRGRMLCARHTAFGHVESCSIHLRMMERVRDRMLYCLGILHESVTPNSTDRSVVPLPRFLHVLYYLIHPVRLAVTYGPSALSRLFRRAS